MHALLPILNATCSRRELLARTGLGFAGTALTAMLAQEL